MNPPPNMNITAGFPTPSIEVWLPAAGSYTSMKRSQVSRCTNMYVASGAICAEAARHPEIRNAMIMMVLFILFVFFVCDQSFRWNESFDRLDVAEEPEGDDAYYSIARYRNDHS